MSDPALDQPAPTGMAVDPFEVAAVGIAVVSTSVVGAGAGALVAGPLADVRPGKGAVIGAGAAAVGLLGTYALLKLFRALGI